MKHYLAIVLVVVTAFMHLSSPAAAQSSGATPGASGEKLRMVVIMMRHGVRSPTDPNEMTPYAAQPWPTWSVPPGYLTAHGAALVTIEGQFYRQYYAAAGLLPATGCPAQNSVYVRGDVDERTKATGDAIVSGLAPGCKISTDVAAGKVDPIFHALPELGKADPAASRASVAGAVGNDPAAVIAANGAAFAKLGTILGCPTATCPALSTVPATLETSSKTGLTSVHGAIDIASTAVETFILEYAEGMPMANVGWGRIDRPAILWLTQLHMLQYSVNTQTYVAARALASNLLATIAGTVDQGVTGKKSPHSPAPADARFVVFAGHDTNLEALAGLMHVRWQLPGYQPNDTPPGGGLVFELWSNAAGATFVRTFYSAQSLDQIRTGTSVANASPQRAPVFIPGCPDLACPVATFQSVVAGLIDPAFVAR